MAAMYSRWDRRDGADRALLATAAFELCRASRQQGARSCRFYWVNADTVVILTEADDQHLFDDEPKPELAQAMFNLSDLARITQTERWMDPRVGEANYRIAGR